ncbi:MAG: tetratricopeptide repeat protein, partial [Lentisphaerota bacterium]
TPKLMDDGKATESLFSLAFTLARLGHLLDHQDWIDETATLTSGPLPTERQGGVYVAREFCDYLVEIGRYADAERLLTEMVSQQVRAQAAAQNEMHYGSDTADDLARLTVLYWKAGRMDDVLAMLEKAPWWGAKDLADLMHEDSLFTATAAALHSAGRDQEALQVVEAALQRQPGQDDNYKILVDIQGTKALPQLDALYQRDRFEERPLIWKSVLLMKAGQLEAAEKTIREAMRVDPTDGEQKKGDRVHAYAVLAEILNAQGKTNDAAFFLNVVESVRIAERGDEFKEAGLLQQSLDLYTQAQSYFADAYCVQWRLAERLHEKGDFKGAQEHYRIAFERMPEQFGQVASLCFGCEGIFDKPQTRSVAEEVLLRLERDNPERPQVYFLLGQLRQAQGRNKEAYQYYRRAVELDPDYLDVWEKIRGISESLFMPARERDAISLHMLKLDPLQRHFSIQLDEITDIKGLWMELDKDRKFALPAPQSVLPLPASTRQLEEQQKTQSREQRMSSAFSRWYSWNEQNKTPSPGNYLARHALVNALMQWAAQAGMEGED